MSDFSDERCLSNPPDSLFLRPERVLYDSVYAPRDLGLHPGVPVEVCGFVGSQAGTNTIFLAFSIAVPSTIRLRLFPVQPQTDRFLQLSLSDGSRQRLPLDEQGYYTPTEIDNTEIVESQAKAPAGRYIATITSSQWQSTPYRILIEASNTVRLAGRVTVTIGYIGTGRSRITGPVRLVARTSNPVPGVNGITPGLARLGLWSGRRIMVLRVSMGITPRLSTSALGSIRTPARVWASRLTTTVETAANNANAPNAVVSFSKTGGTSLSSFMFRPAGGSDAFYAFAYRNDRGAVLWSRLSNALTPGISAGHRLLPLNDGSFFYWNSNNYSGFGDLANNLLNCGVITASGDIRWQRTVQQTELGPSNINTAVESPSNDSIYLAGQGNGFPFGSAFLIRLSRSNGDVMFAYRYDSAQTGLTGSALGFDSLILTPSDTLIMTITATQGTTGTSIMEVSLNGVSFARVVRFANGAGRVLPGMKRTASGRLISRDLSWGAILDSSWNVIFASDFLDPLGSDCNMTEDVDGVLHFCYVNEVQSLDPDGEIIYRSTFLTNSNSLAGVTRDARLIDLPNRFMIFARSAFAVPIGQSVYFVGMEMDNAPASVTNGGISLGSAVGRSNNIGYYWLGDTPRTDDLIRTVITPSGSPTTLTTVVAGTSTRTWSSGAGTLFWDLQEDTILRGGATVWAGPRSTPPPSEDPDSLLSQVSLYLPLSTTVTGDQEVNDLSANAFNMMTAGAGNSSLAQEPFTGGSYLLQSTGRIKALATSAAFQFQRGDWAIECRVWLPAAYGQTGSGDTRIRLFDGQDIGGPTNVRVVFGITGGRKIYGFLGDSFTLASNATLAFETWTHVALRCMDDNVILFVNGIPDQNTFRNTVAFSAASFSMSAVAGASGSSDVHIRDFRVTKGSPRFSKRFTPRTTAMSAAAPGASTADGSFASVVLSLPLSYNDAVITSGPHPSITDFSNNDFILAAGGSPFVNNVQPLFGRPTLQIYGQWIEAPANTAFDITADYTIEGFFWADPTLNTAAAIISRGATGTTGAWSVSVAQSTSVISLQFGNPNVTVNFGTITRSAWTFFAVSRVSGTWNCYLGATRNATLADATSLVQVAVLQGGRQNGAGGNWSGHLAHLRLTKGVGRYSGSTLTVPTQRFPVR